MTIRQIDEETIKIEKYIAIDKKNGEKYLRVATRKRYDSSIKWYGTFKLIDQPVMESDWHELPMSRSEELEKTFKKLEADRKVYWYEGA